MAEAKLKAEHDKLQHEWAALQKADPPEVAAARVSEHISKHPADPITSESEWNSTKGGGCCGGGSS